MILIKTFMLLFHLFKTIQDVNMGIRHNLKTNGFAIDHIIICGFQEIKYFCSTLKNAVYHAGRNVFFGA